MEFLILSIVFVLALMFLFTHHIKPGSRGILIDNRGQPPRCIEAGLHFIPNLWIARFNVAASSWKGFGDFPAENVRYFLDPPATQIHTADSVPGVADCSVEVVVQKWQAEDATSDCSCIRRRSCNLVNQWLAEQLSLLRAEECTYGYIASRLNSEKAITELNIALAANQTFLQAHRVTIDADGIAMNREWAQQRNQINQARQQLAEREKQLKAELELERLERQKMDEAETYKLELQKRKDEAEAEREAMHQEASLLRERKRVEAAMESEKLEAEVGIIKAKAEYEAEQVRMKMRQEAAESRNRVEVAQLQAMLQGGVTSDQYTQLAKARTVFEGMSACQGAKVIAVPPGLLGLDWTPRHGMQGLDDARASGN